jgi:hypothetical protein
MSTTTITRDTIRSLLCQVWMEQATWKPEQRPRLLERLLQDRVEPAEGDRPRIVRDSYRPRLEAACDALAAAFATGIPNDVPRLIFQHFPLLNRQHRERLAQLLIAAAQGGAP